MARFHNCLILDRIKDRPTREWYIRSTVEHGWSRNVLAMQLDTRQLRLPDLEKDLRTGDGDMAKAFDRMLFLTATPLQLGHHELVRVLERFEDVRCGRSLTEPLGQPKVSNIAGDLRSEVSAGSENLADRGRLFPAGCLILLQVPRSPRDSGVSGIRSRKL